MLRLLLDLLIFLARHAVLTFAVCLLGAWLLARARFSVPGRSGGGFFGGLAGVLSRRYGDGRRLIVGAAASLVLIFTAIGVWYVTTDGFAGEVEPVVSCLSWLVQTGRPLYTDFDAAERYSVLYGPSVFLTNGLFLRILGPSLASAKVASVIGTVGSLVFLFAAVSRRRQTTLAWAVTGLAVLYYWTQGFAVYLVRPDALLLFAVGLGLYAAVRTGRLLAICTVAATAGFAINLKAHGAVYFLPVFVLLAGRFGRRSVAYAGALTALVVASPFFLYPQVSLINYVGWLTNAMSHGLETHTLGQTFGYAAFLMLPVLCALAVGQRPGELARKHQALLTTMVPVYGLTLLLASKPGAGPVHLLPLVPSTMYLLAVVVRDVLAEERHAVAWPGLQRATVVATVLTALLAGSVNAYRAVRFVDYEIGQTPDLMQDVQEIMHAYPGLTLSMACGGENLSFRTTWLRPLLVFADNPLLIDPISVMDSSLSGRELSAETYRAIAEGVVAVWLVPKQQQPFAKENWYAPHNPLFPPEFREHFLSWYTPRDHSRYFDLWFWNGLTETTGPAPFYAGSVPTPTVQ